MAEYIDRDKLLKRFCGHCSGNEDGCKIQKECFDLKIIKSMPAADVQPTKWIPVSKLLPDSKTEVLVYYEWIGRSGNKYKEIEILSFDEVYKSSITPIAWMPIPELPKDDETWVTKENTQSATESNP